MASAYDALLPGLADRARMARTQVRAMRRCTDERKYDMFKDLGRYTKGLVAAMGAVSSSLSLYYGSSKWEPVVVAGLSALMVVLVPNSTSNPKPPAPNASISAPPK